MNSSTDEAAMRPLPLADDASAGFWEAANQGRLAIQRCTRCRRWNHAPSIACPSCGSFELGYEDVSGKGTLFSWTVLKEAPAPGFRDRLPLIVGVIELAEQKHLVLAANILEASVEDLKLGMPLEVVFEKITEDCTLPQFRPVKG
jgi:uncharacterized OB-fold protein